MILSIFINIIITVPVPTIEDRPKLFRGMAVRNKLAVITLWLPLT